MSRQMSERGLSRKRVEVIEEFDPDDGRLVLSYQVRDKSGQVVLSLNLDRSYTPSDIANCLRDDALDILLNASRVVPAEEVLKVTRLLNEEARKVLG